MPKDASLVKGVRAPKRLPPSLEAIWFAPA
jgi:hypothetical protein